MPWWVRKKGSQWIVIGASGKIHGHHKTRKAALRQLRAIYANADPSEHRKK